MTVITRGCGKQLKSKPLGWVPCRQLKQNTRLAMVSCSRRVHIVMKISKPATLAWFAAAAEMVDSLARVLNESH